MRVRTARVTAANAPGDQTILTCGGDTRQVSTAELLPFFNPGAVTEEKIRRAIKLDAYRNGSLDPDTGAALPLQIDTLFFRSLINGGNYEGICTMKGRVYIDTNVVEQGGGWVIPYTFNTTAAPFQPLRMDKEYLFNESAEDPLVVAQDVIRDILWTRFRGTLCVTHPEEIRVSEARELYPVIINLIAGMDIFYFGAN